MRHLIRISLLALLFTIASIGLSHLNLVKAQQSDKASSKQSSSGDKKTPTGDQKIADYSQEAFVIEQYKMTYRFESDGTGLRDVTMRVKVQSEAAIQAFGQLVLPYLSANEKIAIEHVTVHKQDGTTVSANDSNVQELSAPVSRTAPVYTDVKAKHVTVPGLRPGDTLDYHVIWHVVTPLAPNQFWLTHDFSSKEAIVLDERLEVNVPQSSVVKLKNEQGLDPEIKEEGGRRIYTWKHANLKRPEKEDPERSVVKVRRTEPKPPQIQMTTFKNWDEVGRWYYELQRDRVVPDDKIRAKVLEITKGLNSDQEKIQALYSFVAKNFRYVSLSLGQGRYQPHAATEILANQYGDCKDKHTLLASMLLATGIKAYPVLMNSSHKLDPDVPSPGQFDHVITAVPMGNELWWMDTTAEVAPFRMIAPQLRKKQGLLIPENAAAHLETTPADLPFLATELVEIEGKVNDQGELSGHAHMILRGDSEMMLRIMFRRTPKNDWNNLKYYLSGFSAGGYKSEITEVRPSDPNATEKPFELDYDFTEPNFFKLDSQKETVGLPLPSIHLPNEYSEPDDSTKSIDLGPMSDITYRVKLTVPAKYQSRLPIPIKLNRDYAEYDSTYKLTGNTVEAERTLKTRMREIPEDREHDLRAFEASTKADEEQSISLETNSPVAERPVESMKPEELRMAASSAQEEGNYAKAELLFKALLAKDDNDKDKVKDKDKDHDVRQSLAFALYSQRKYEEAIKILDEQIKDNSYDAYAYNLSGRIYRDQRKYAEAEKAYRKQLEIAPLDKRAQGSLALMLVEWRKYKEAIPELERAISLNADDEAQYDISLGRAYANLGQIGKATEAFDKGMKDSKDPLTLNDAAYYMSVSNIGLDKAQEYAESAVDEVATDLRSVKLVRLTIEDLSNVNSLASYWDTLGWVQFKKGNIDVAEKYIMAAWLLGQHSEVGDHLGQISEKRGKKDEAIHWYALAVVASRPAPEASEDLERMVGKDKMQALTDKAKDELVVMRTIKLDAPIKDEKEKLEAEFYISIMPSSSGKNRVVEVKFIKGAEKLKPLTSVLQSATYNMTFPDDTATRLIRRGTVKYDPKTGCCTFVMVQPNDVISVDLPVDK